MRLLNVKRTQISRSWVVATETVGEDINESSVEDSLVEEDDDVPETNDHIDEAYVEAMIRDIRFPDLEVGATETVDDTNDVTETNADIDDFEAMFRDDWH